MVCSGAQILQKVGPVWTECRSLEALEIWFYPTPVSFRWAVEEKHRRQQEGHDSKQNLPPLRHITIREYNDTPVVNIDDLAVAFSDSLETIIYDCYSGDMGQYEGPNSRFATTRVTLTAGHQWVTMPALKSLAIATSKHDLVLDSALLSLCPAVQSLELYSQRRDFNPATRTWDEPVQLPGLMKLQLIGAPAQNFKMDTFASTPLIRSIELAVSEAGINSLYHMEAPGYDYHPDLPNSPRQWSWNWDLPCLTSLVLGAGFANLFEFRMLDGCPSLDFLTLAMAGAHAPRGGRHVRETDFISRRGTALGYISCPQLTGMTLRGQFVLAPEVLQVLFTHVMPHLTMVEAAGCRGHGVEGWLRSVQGLKDLVKAWTDLPEPTETEMEALGLRLYGDGYFIPALEVRDKAVYQFERAYVMRD